MQHIRRFLRSHAHLGAAGPSSPRVWQNGSGFITSTAPFCFRSPKRSASTTRPRGTPPTDAGVAEAMRQGGDADAAALAREAARLAKQCLPHAVITEGVRFTRHHRNDGHAGSPVKGIIQLVRTFWERSLDGSWAPGPEIAGMRVPTGPHDGQCPFLGPCI